MRYLRLCSRDQTDGLDFSEPRATAPGADGCLIRFAQDYFGPDAGGLIGRAAARLLQETVTSLRCSIDVLGKGEELAAEHLRVAAHSLGRLLGRVDVEDILDVIFREFCIGK